MRRTHIVVVLALIAMVTAALAGTEALRSPARDGACFGSEAATYQFTTRATADYTIRVDNAATHPDLVVQIVDDPVAADFVMLAEADQANDCRAARTIRLDPNATDPDLVVSLSRESAEGRVRIYAQAPDFTLQDAAALFAVMRKAPKKRVAATLR